ncbi:hypothetical protein D1839_07545 [Roseburia sp. 1XD42-34]|nr:hypothetical protein [Roseburia sp. 1XD42-34]RKI78991.1 hypothetical protein D7V87_07535 [Clostridium sp. 1xD42-85]
MSKAGNAIIAQGTVIYLGREQSIAHNENYTIETDANWVTKRLSIVVDNFPMSDGEGNWFNTDGESINKLKGAIDIDISAILF